jgi:uncharacterized delta-60 repeat protein
MPCKFSCTWKLILGCLASLTPLGLLSAAPVPQPDSLSVDVRSVYAVAVQGDGKLPIGGTFTSVAGESRNGIARLSSEGELDAGFYPFPTKQTLAITVQQDGAILIGGAVGTGTPFISRIKPDGSLDSAFGVQLESPVPSATVRSIAVTAEGQILVGGAFNSISGVTVGNLVRLNPDGTLDEAFKGFAHSSVYAVVLQNDGKILIGGQFSTVNGVPRFRLARLNADGSLDETFAPAIGGGLVYVYTILQQPDGKILIGGNFPSVSGEARNFIARLNSDGSLDRGFEPAPITGEGPVYSMALQADGMVVLGGKFTQVAGESRQGLVRLNGDGSVDASFTTDALASSASTPVSGLAIQPDGKLIVTGAYTNLGAQVRTGIGRLEPAGPVAEGWVLAGDELTWKRGGSACEIWRASFDYSTDDLTWYPLGEGVHADGGWKVNGLLAIPQTAKIRATGWTTGGHYNGSGWWFERIVRLSDLVHLEIHTAAPNFGFSDTHFAFYYSGPAGVEVVVEQSSDFNQWIPVLTNTLSTTPLLFTDPGSVRGDGSRFYRLRRQ